MAKFNITILFVLAFAFMATDRVDETVLPTVCEGLELNISPKKSENGYFSISAVLSFKTADDQGEDNNQQGDDDDQGSLAETNLFGTPYENVKFHYVFYEESGRLLSMQYESSSVNDLAPGTYYCTVVGPEGCKVTESIVIK